MEKEREKRKDKKEGKKEQMKKKKREGKGKSTWKKVNFFFVLLCLGAIPSFEQGLLLALNSGITPVWC